MREMIHALTPIIWAGVILVLAWMRHERKMAAIHAQRQTPDVDALTSAHAAEVAQLRDRVRVLERIATDAERHTSSHRLAAQIDALRD